MIPNFVWFVAGFLTLSFFIRKTMHDYSYQWFTLAGKDHEVLELIATKHNEARKKVMTALLHEDTIADDGWLHVPVVLPGVVGMPVARAVPLTLVWISYNLIYKLKYRGRGFLWQVPRTRVLNRVMQNYG